LSLKVFLFQDVSKKATVKSDHTSDSVQRILRIWRIVFHAHIHWFGIA